MKKISITLVSIVCFTIISFAAYDIFNKSDNVIIPEAEYAFDVSNRDLLVGWAENVFVGTISQKVRESKDEVSPYSVYNVKVDENIKGILNGIITITHRVAYDNEEKALFKFEGDDFLIENSKYLFVSRKDPKTGTHTVVPVYGTILLDDSEKAQEIKSDFYEATKNQRDPFTISHSES